jgi:hypothetical protein
MYLYDDLRLRYWKGKTSVLQDRAHLSFLCCDVMARERAPLHCRLAHRQRLGVRDRLLNWNSSYSDDQLHAAMDRLFGPILYRLLIRHVPVKSKHIQEAVDRALEPITSKN